MPWCPLALLGQGKMLEIAFLRISFLVGKAADFLQDSKVMADGINRVSFFSGNEVLIVVDKLFRQLPECQILDFIPVVDEFSEFQAHIVVAGISSFRTVYADT